jgi:hypothetical protein
MTRFKELKTLAKIAAHHGSASERKRRHEFAKIGLNTYDLTWAQAIRLCVLRIRWAVWSPMQLHLHRISRDLTDSFLRGYRRTRRRSK